MLVSLLHWWTHPPQKLFQCDGWRTMMECLCRCIHGYFWQPSTRFSTSNWRMGCWQALQLVADVIDSNVILVKSSYLQDNLLDLTDWDLLPTLWDPWGLFFIYLTHESGISNYKGMNSGWMNLGWIFLYLFLSIKKDDIQCVFFHKIKDGYFITL